MMYRDGIRTNFPRATVTEEDVKNAKSLDLEKKLCNQEKVNSSKYRKRGNFMVGDRVMVRNFKKTSKFDPLFEKDPYVITNIDASNSKLTVNRAQLVYDGWYFKFILYTR